MGGTIGFTLREEDGTEWRMSRWTNWTPWAIDNIDLVHKNPAHIKNILEDWKEALKLPKKDRHWSYGSPFLAPSEYGLVVVDLKNNVILDCNYYHAFGRMSAICLNNEFHATIHPGGGYTLGSNIEGDGFKAFLVDKDNDAAKFYQFYKEGRIKDFTAWNKEKKEHVSIGEDINRWPIEKVVDDLILTERFGTFILDMHPFKIITFKEGAQGFRDFRQAVVDLGFKLTAQEEKIWAERIQRYDEEYDEENESENINESDIIDRDISDIGD